MSRFIAFYLPQYYPIPENDKWYGKGFTEWTNVAKAKPLFHGHYEPHVPADLGFYDMRLKDTIIAQAEMAQRYGIEGFCYWHYWFGNKKQLLETPFNELVNNKEINIKFCLSWANSTWYASKWEGHESKEKIIVEQQYPGLEDVDEHFYCYLDAFKDNRYIKVNNKALFCVHNPRDFKSISDFISRWRELAQKEGINDFYFVARDSCNEDKEWCIGQGFDAVYEMNGLKIHKDNKNKLFKGIMRIRRELFHKPTVYQYKDAVKHMITDAENENNSFPVVVPNWDHSPRSLGDSIILSNCDPQYFKWLVKKAMSVNHQEDEENLIFIQSWNEWGEGNHLEPDLKYGLGYLEALQQAREEFGNAD